MYLYWLLCSVLHWLQMYFYYSSSLEHASMKMTLKCNDDSVIQIKFYIIYPFVISSYWWIYYCCTTGDVEQWTPARACVSYMWKSLHPRRQLPCPYCENALPCKIQVCPLWKCVPPEVMLLIQNKCWITTETSGTC